MGKTRKTLTGKMAALVKDQTKNPTKSVRQSMRDVGYSEGTVRGAYATSVMKRISTPLAAAMRRQGITDDLLAKRIKDGLSAEKVSRAQHEGRFIDQASDIDHPTRRSFIELASKFFGYSTDAVTINNNTAYIIPNDKQAALLTMAATRLPTVMGGQ